MVHCAADNLSRPIASGEMIRYLLIAALLVASTVEAKQPRSASARVAFKHAHPCPATGAARGRCPGYVIDHIKPLACGGPDRPENMQWQATQSAKEKDRWERAGCTPRKR